MTLVGVDDTDSRTAGMCTTFAADRIARRIEAAGGAVRCVLLVRLNPAVEYKTRGNAALAVHASVDPDTAVSIATSVLQEAAIVEDDRTNPGLVVAPGDPDAVPDAVAAFAREAVRDHHDLDDATDLLASLDYRSRGWGSGRGQIGALAAVGAWRAFGGVDGDWTYERIAYRAPDRRGTPREVDAESVFAAADRFYPDAWDTVDRVEGETVCVPHSPGPILYGIRGDDPETVRSVAAAIDAEPTQCARTFVTNQGTDAHLQSGTVRTVADGRSYRVDGVVVEPPRTETGGHVFVAIASPSAVDGADSPSAEGGAPAVTEATDGDTGDRTPADASDDSVRPAAPAPVRPVDPTAVPDADRLPCVAFEPTKRFRDRVRGLLAGDRITACGELAGGTLKLEKFALRRRRQVEWTTPDCPTCGRSMESAGADQGYRCRDCSETAPGKVPEPIERDLDPGWYEVPPCARRHLAKPLVRGGFDVPTHPER